MELKEALRTLRADPEKGRAFMSDPSGTLSSMGVDVSQHKISTTQHVPTGATHGACGSAGCGVCASVG